MGQEVRPFYPLGGRSVTIANAVASATPGVPLQQTWESIVLTNTSTTAIAYVRLTQQDTPTAINGDAPTATADLPILPMSQIRIWAGVGLKVIRAIASAADGNLIVTPGDGV